MVLLGIHWTLSWTNCCALLLPRTGSCRALLSEMIDWVPDFQDGCITHSSPCAMPASLQAFWRPKVWRCNCQVTLYFLSSLCSVFDIATRLPQCGVGARVQRVTWGDDSYWDITKIKPKKDGKGGDAWGILTWRGTPQGTTPKQVRGPLKKVWRWMPDKETSARWAPLVEASRAAAAGEPPSANPDDSKSDAVP
ncbi:unnamed protein product [Ostreobium quekettii]|uniref:Uncharacterized protein n=1 Tax=Ostreobium quekettii TaxID=121088 RepID=A0A8S1IPY7_9CHLO|nr:unnamed protein product [Ostreobium quekettii]|eukprot:evm.model.scf_107.2 EVM.evm.TU.scf_107.2   scf_107:28824-31202(-)